MVSLRAAVLMLCFACAAFVQQSAVPAPQRDQIHPELSHRPPPDSGANGKMQLDVVVTDASGHPVASLEQQSFTLLDNKQPRSILSFREVNGVQGAGPDDPPVQVILLIDFANTTLQRVAYTRRQIENYLRRDGGRLPQPTSVLLFFDQKLKVLPGPSTDGNLLVREIDQSTIAIHNIPLVDGNQMLERLSLSLRSLGSIAASESKQRGRKLMIWVGPGWPMLDTPWYQAGTSARQHLFSAIVELSQELREARMTLYSVYPTDPAFNDTFAADFYRSYLKPVSSRRQLVPGNLALPVLAIHSGGLALHSGGDLPALLDRCVQDASVYYTLTFDPPAAERVDEYHELKVVTDRPGLVVRTRSGYYAEPRLR